MEIGDNCRLKWYHEIHINDSERSIRDHYFLRLRRFEVTIDSSHSNYNAYTITAFKLGKI